MVLSPSIMVFPIAASMAAESHELKTTADEYNKKPKLTMDLVDDLLLEILLRLPDRLSVVRCSAVCKRWHSLLSNPSFVRDFTHRRRRDHHSPRPYAFWFQFRFKKFTFTSQVCSTQSKEFLGWSSSYNLLGFLPEANPAYEVLASCNDLLLVRSDEYLLVCNPFTKQWNHIPEPPQDSFTVKMWLTCHPDQLRFKVVRVLDTRYHMFYSPKVDVRIFFSDTGEWTTRTVVFPRALSRMCPFRRCMCCDVATSEDGTLYWLDGMDRVVRGLVAFNPFDEEVRDGQLRGRVIDVSKVFTRRTAQSPMKISFCLGMFKGRLRAACLDVSHGPRVLCVVELGDDESSWHLKHYTKFKSLSKTIHVLGIHPNEGDVLFLLYGNEVVRFKFDKIEERKVVGTFPKEVRHLLGEPQNYELHNISAFPIVFPPWPTQLPSLLS